ncbi:hypothetical protein F8388_025779 [Cannabis sativa]|uniref:COMM domain-containing protein n=1 Tax=Cannabis sativa TaxID=3483 RepID=A0A7J6HP23_CANSA|nr:hypothetical protein F8388_025779 [Cannabis sativa]KAF4397006.1 hypothetical protein G4B88_008852 [Cannabis sativa]
MEIGENSLYQQLHKLSGVKSEEALDQLISALWQTRKTGLRGHHDKSHFKTLLNLPSLSDLDPVLACLRCMIRKCAYGNFSGDDVLKVVPPDLPIELQRILLILFQKYQSQWKQDVSKEQRLLPRTNVSYHDKLSTPQTFTPFQPSSNTSARQNDPIAQLDQTGIGAASTPIVPENMGSFPNLKSMTWTMENCSSDQAKKVAIISLKLQDYLKSSSGEVEVKFQLTKDTLDAMLRSLTYINDQLSGMVGNSSEEPIQKKQKQSDT